MKRIIVLLSLLIVTSVNAESMLFGGVMIPENGDMGFTAGYSWFNKKLGPATMGIDASYSDWNGSGVVEGMAMLRFGRQIFIDAGAGLEYFTSSLTEGSVKLGLGANVGYRFGTFFVQGRVRSIDSNFVFGGVFGFKF